MSELASVVDDATIKNALTSDIGPLDHPDVPNVADVREALDWMQQSMEGVWADWCTNIKHNESEAVHEDGEVIIFATGEQNVPRRDLRDHYPADLHDRMPGVVSQLHHAVARDRTDYDWGYEYPLVVAKAGLNFDDGQRYVEAVVNALQRRGLSPGQAWSYYGVIIRGNSRNAWASHCGYSDHSAVSEAVRKAQKKIL